MSVIGERPRVAAELFPVRELIRDELAFRGIDERTTIVAVRTFLSGDGPMTPRVAQALAAMFATSAELWINVDAAHRAWEAAQS